MSDSNIYMAINAVSLLSITPTSSSLLFSFRFRRVQEEVRGKTGGRPRGTEGGFCSKSGGWSRRDAICSPHYFRIRWSPSPSSSVEGWGEKKGKLNPRKTYTRWSYFEEVCQRMTACVCVFVCACTDLWQWWSKNCSHQASCKPSGIKGQNEDGDSNIHIMNGLFRGERGYNTVHYVQCERHAN